MSTATDTRALVDEVMAAYFAHDADRLASYYADDAVLEFPGAPPAVGRHAIHDAWAGWFTAFPDVGGELHHLATDGDVALLEWTERGTHHGPFTLLGLDVAPTGNRFEWRAASVYEFDDDSIRAVRYHVDPAPLFSALDLARS